MFMIVACIAATLLAAHFFVPDRDSSDSSSIAAAFPKIVSGHVYDSQPVNVSGASVTVTILNGVTERASQTTTTDGDGFYQVTFDGTNWDISNTIKVDAALDTLTGTYSVVADGTPAQTVDVYFSSPIPEFGNLAVVCGAVLAVFLVFSRRSRGKAGA